MNVYGSDNLWLKSALEDKSRIQSLQRLERLRKVQLWMLLSVTVVFGFMVFASIAAKQHGLGDIAFGIAIVYSIKSACEQTNTEIKLLKLAGALQETQRTKDDAASS